MSGVFNYKIRRDIALSDAVGNLNLIKKAAERIGQVEFDENDINSVWSALEGIKRDVLNLPGLMVYANRAHSKALVYDDLYKESKGDK